jgi:hypothetical protein
MGGVPMTENRRVLTQTVDGGNGGRRRGGEGRGGGGGGMSYSAGIDGRLLLFLSRSLSLPVLATR